MDPPPGSLTLSLSLKSFLVASLIFPHSIRNTTLGYASARLCMWQQTEVVSHYALTTNANTDLACQSYTSYHSAPCLVSGIFALLVSRAGAQRRKKSPICFEAVQSIEPNQHAPKFQQGSVRHHQDIHTIMTTSTTTYTLQSEDNLLPEVSRHKKSSKAYTVPLS